MKKRLLGMILALCMLLGLCACGGESAPASTPDAASSSGAAETPEEQEPEQGAPEGEPAEEGAPAEAESALPDTLTIGTTSKVTVSFDGSDESNTFGCALCSDMLVYIDTDGEIKSHILESWESTDEGLSMTLKEGVTFTDGRACTAEDILWSFVDANERGSGAAEWVEYFDWDNAEISDDGLTLFVPTFSPYAPGIITLTSGSAYIKSKSYFEDHPATDEIWWDTVEGTGPYECVEQVDGAYATYRLRDNYWGDEEFVYKEITFNYYSDDNAMAIELQNGAIDVMLDTTAFYVEEFEGNADFIVKRHGEGNIVCLAIDPVLVPEYQNEKVREAIGLALNADEAGLIGTSGMYVVADSVFPTTCLGYKSTGTYLNGSEEDIAKAKELLAEAGYPNGFSMLLSVRDNSTDVGEYIQGALGKIGITCEFEFLEFMNFIMKNRSGEIACTVDQVQTDNSGEPSNVYSMMMTTQPSTLGVIMDDEFNDLCRQASTTIDEAERISILEQIQDYVYEGNYRYALYEQQKGWVYKAGVLPEDFECYWGNIPGGFRLEK